MKRAPGASLVVTLLVALSGCGDSDLSLEEFFDEGEAISCNFQVDCGFLPDAATCRALANTDDDLAEARNAVDGGRVSFDGAAARECLDAVREQLTCNVGEFGGFGTPESCDRVTTGLVELGGDCFDETECAGDAECIGEDTGQSCSPGTCVQADPEPARVGEGGDCSAAECQDGLFCLREGLDATCTARAGEGEECQGLGSCVDGFACDAPFLGVGSCIDPAARGEQCNQELGLVACELLTDVCDPVSGVCVRRPEPGETCNPDSDLCIEYAFCNSDGVCEQNPGEGDFCSTDFGSPDCLGDLDCVQGQCTADDDPVCLPE